MKNYPRSIASMLILSTTITQKRSDLLNIVYSQPRAGLSFLPQDNSHTFLLGPSGGGMRNNSPAHRNR